MTTFSCVDDLYQSLIDESQKEKNEEVEESILETLFRDQKYDLVLYALEKGFMLTPERVDQIKISGDLKLYQYLFQHEKLELNLKLMNLSVGSGKLETVKWLRKMSLVRDQRSPTRTSLGNESTCTYAAWKGHLEVLKWLRENGYPWDGLTCLYSARNGHLEVLKWSRENGCPWNKEECLREAKNYPEIVEWIKAN